jgi:hypothetical protein
MIDIDDLERKDFSVCLPNIIAKLSFLASAVGDAGYAEYCGLFDSPSDYAAFGCMLREIAGDLSEIDGALYPPQVQGAQEATS